MTQEDETSGADTPLARWVRNNGKGATARIARHAGLSWPSVADVVKGRATPRVETARLISAATGGAVTVAEILGLRESDVRGEGHEKSVAEVVTPRECA